MLPRRPRRLPLRLLLKNIPLVVDEHRRACNLQNQNPSRETLSLLLRRQQHLQRTQRDVLFIQRRLPLSRPESSSSGAERDQVRECEKLGEKSSAKSALCEPHSPDERFSFSVSESVVSTPRLRELLLEDAASQAALKAARSEAGCTWSQKALYLEAERLSRREASLLLAWRVALQHLAARSALSSRSILVVLRECERRRGKKGKSLLPFKAAERLRSSLQATPRLLPFVKVGLLRK